MAGHKVHGYGCTEKVLSFSYIQDNEISKTSLKG